MKVALSTLACAASASAFIPSSSLSSSSSVRPTRSSSSAISYAAELEDMVGADVETGGIVWDPLDLSDYVPASWAREAELANGRSAMLATVGYLWPNTIGHFTSTDVTTTDPFKAIVEADTQWWAQFIVLCGTIEGYKYSQSMKGKSYIGGGGDPVFDFMKGYPDDEKGRKIIELQELKNGRLAMLGIASFASAHFIPGSVPLLGTGF